VVAKLTTHMPLYTQMCKMTRIWSQYVIVIIYLRQRRRYMFSPTRPRSFVCLSVSKLTQKRVLRFGWNVACRQMSRHGRTY